MSQAKSNGQIIYDIVTVMDVRIRNLEPGHSEFEERIVILALRITIFHSCLDILSEQNRNTASAEAIS